MGLDSTAALERYQHKAALREVRHARALAFSVQDIQAAAEKIRELLQSDDDKVALTAARDILDRSLGKPHQSVSTHVTHTPADLSDAELEDQAWRILQARRKRQSQ